MQLLSDNAADREGKLASLEGQLARALADLDVCSSALSSHLCTWM